MQRVACIRHVASRCPQGVKFCKPPTQSRYASSRQAKSSPRISAQPSAPAPLPTRPRLSASQTVPWVLGSIVAAGLGLYVAALVVAVNKPCHNAAVKELAAQKDVAARYEETADDFDGEVGVSEILMGINRIRKRLAQQASGHVLEVSCGTGRNIGYFDLGPTSAVSSLTFVDLAPQMVEVCKRKWLALGGDEKRGLKRDLVVRFLSGSALDPMPMSPPTPTSKKYDTIVQTMGLCSTSSPVQLIENMARHLDSSNPNARILLLEHGRSYQQWLNKILDNSAEKHAEIHGCWFNRDIGALVEEAAVKTGLEVVNERRHHFGTTWVFELKPKTVTNEPVAQPSVPPIPEGESLGKWFSWYK